VDSIGDAVFCAGDSTLAVVKTALRLCHAIEREPEFPRASMAIHRGPLVEREGRLLCQARGSILTPFASRLVGMSFSELTTSPEPSRSPGAWLS
jgi:hypothetical protein